MAKKVVEDVEEEAQDAPEERKQVAKSHKRGRNHHEGKERSKDRAPQGKVLKKPSVGFQGKCILNPEGQGFGKSRG